MAEPVEHAPFHRVRLHPIAILIERPQLQLGEPAAQPLAHLAPHLTKALPSQPQARQRPLQEAYEFLVAHARAPMCRMLGRRHADVDGQSARTSAGNMCTTSSISPGDILRTNNLKTSFTSASVSALGSCLNAASI